MNKTYNLGRVVGWSNYEEFLKENPDIDPSTVTRYVYETLVTYGVTRIVALSLAGWQPSNGGKFYTQTVRVPGASWGSVPIVGLHYEHYMQVFTNPQAVDMTPAQKQQEAEAEPGDATDKNGVEAAVSTIFGVYVSDASGRKMQSSADEHGYLTFMAHPDILKFQENVPGLEGEALQLIVRGLSLEELSIDELYFGPQGFIFAGNGLIEECYHKTENINNLMLMASSYVEFAITGSATSRGGAYKYYESAEIQLEGVVTGYLDLGTLEDEGYLMTAAQAAQFIDGAAAVGAAVTHDAYSAITDKDDYFYIVYGATGYTSYPPGSSPMYILCVRKSDGYTGLGVLLDFGDRAKLGYDAQNPDESPARSLNLLHSYGTGSQRVITIKDKHMPDYFGSYWAQSNGWDGVVSYLQQNGISDWEWNDLKDQFGAVFLDAGRNSYITCTPTPTRTAIIKLGDVVRIIGDGGFDDDMEAIRGMYVCTESVDSDSQATTITLSRRGGYLTTTTEAPGGQSGGGYTRLPQWTYQYHTPASQDPFLTANADNSNRIYQNEMIYVVQPTPTGYSNVAAEWQVVNIATSGNPDLIVYRSQAFPLSDASAGVSNYSGPVVHSLTNAIKRTGIDDLLPTTITVHENPYSATTETYTITRGGNADAMTIGTIVSLKHTVTDVFGDGKTYWYQYLGQYLGSCVLASSVSQKDGTNFYSVAKMTSHLNQGFPRAKQNIPDESGSYHYNYPQVMSRIPVGTFFDDFDLDITEYLHPDYRNTSLLKFMQNMIIYKDLSQPPSLTNKRTFGFSTSYRFYKRDEAQSILNTQPTSEAPIRASMLLEAATDPTSFTSPGFFTAQRIDPVQNAGGYWVDNPIEEPHSIANPDYPIWATIAKSKSGTETMSVSLIDNEGSRLNSSGSEGTIEADTVTPQDLLVGLAIGKSVDPLRGLRVRREGSSCNYLETVDGLRIYLASTEPDPNVLDIPLGSVGIGW